MQASADLERLRAMIVVPHDVREVRWVARALGASGDVLLPGPTDARLVAFLAVDDSEWTAIEATLGPSRAEESATLSADEAHAVLGTTAQGADRGVIVSGPSFDPETMSSPLFRVGTAVRTAGGVLIVAVSS